MHPAPTTRPPQPSAARRRLAHALTALLLLASVAATTVRPAHAADPAEGTTVGAETTAPADAAVPADPAPAPDAGEGAGEPAGSDLNVGAAVDRAATSPAVDATAPEAGAGEPIGTALISAATTPRGRSVAATAAGTAVAATEPLRITRFNTGKAKQLGAGGVMALTVGLSHPAELSVSLRAVRGKRTRPVLGRVLRTKVLAGQRGTNVVRLKSSGIKPGRYRITAVATAADGSTSRRVRTIQVRRILR